jgi:hypothetical protein
VQAVLHVSTASSRCGRVTASVYRWFCQLQTKPALCSAFGGCPLSPGPQAGLIADSEADNIKKDPLRCFYSLRPLNWSHLPSLRAGGGDRA